MPPTSSVATFVFLFLSGFASAQDTPPPPEPIPKDNPAVFEKRMPADELTGLAHFAGSPSGDVYRDKQFHKLMKSFVPECMFHYGRDMPLSDALEQVLKISKTPVLLRDGRYLMLIGHNGPYLHGRGFLWLDLQERIGLGVFFLVQRTESRVPPSVYFRDKSKRRPCGWVNCPPRLGRT